VPRRASRVPVATAKMEKTFKVPATALWDRSMVADIVTACSTVDVVIVSLDFSSLMVRRCPERLKRYVL